MTRLAELASLIVVAGPLAAQELLPPVRLEADGQPIEVDRLSQFAHAGPCLADVDGDGDRDLLVGDFPGNVWHFENTGDDRAPSLHAKGDLPAVHHPEQLARYLQLRKADGEDFAEETRNRVAPAPGESSAKDR